MEIPEHRRWMYNRLNEKRSAVKDEFYFGVQQFMNFVKSQDNMFVRGKLRCPCVKCKGLRWKTEDDTMVHLFSKGFMPNYYRWTFHGETPEEPPAVQGSSYYGAEGVRETYNSYEQLVMDAAGPSVGIHLEDNAVVDNDDEVEHVEEDPNEETQKFYDMLSAAQQPLYEGCDTQTELSMSLWALSLKADYNMSGGCFDRMVEGFGNALPSPNRMPHNLYYAKKNVQRLGMGCMKIDCCPNGCMLYYKDDEALTECRVCGTGRYKTRSSQSSTLRPVAKMWYFPIIPRLQRLYSSLATASQMRWHYENRREDDVLCHPSHGEAWRHFDRTYPDFASDPRNVRLGLCSDGFNPHGQYGSSYSCWPVIMTPYNLPPWMCMKREVMFLSEIIPGPSNPKSKIDIYLEPLIDDLKILWNDGVLTYDASLRQNFMMHAALMWTINDFPAYGMLSGWSTAGKLACPICMNQCKVESLPFSKKISFFDYHRRFLPRDHPFRRNRNAFKKGVQDRNPIPVRYTGEQIWEIVKEIPTVNESQGVHCAGYGVMHNWTKQSVFWSLPYWKSHLLPYNIDVMHTERNVFMNIFNTVMDIKDKTKDTVKSRLDIAQLCKRPELELQKVSGSEKYVKPKAKYTLDKSQRMAICEWIKKLKLPDGYASNLSRCVNLKEANLHGMKSHDCHVFMQRLLPIAFDSLPKEVWKPLVELSNFFKDLTCTVLRVDDLKTMDQNIPIILCKLEQIFPPSFFDSMEHLPIHLPYEARVGGPVQYRWMYPFERFLRTLKEKVKNKARPEGSICEAYLVEESSTFASYYYPPDVPSRMTRLPRNDDGESSSATQMSVFNFPGRGGGKCQTLQLDQRDWNAATLYTLNNTPEVEPYLGIFIGIVRELTPSISDAEIDAHITSNFAGWFRRYVDNPSNNIQDHLLKALALGPIAKVESWPIYLVNGYRFHTYDHGQDKGAQNYGVCVRGSHGQSEDDFYGILKNIFELSFIGWPTKKLVLFKCEWYDNSINGTKVDNYGHVQVKQSRRYRRAYDPFIFAQQAEQVYYTPYPEGHPGWLTVIKVKARGAINTPDVDTDLPYQDEHSQHSPIVQVDTNDIQDNLADLNGEAEEVQFGEITIQLNIAEDPDHSDTDNEYTDTDAQDRDNDLDSD